MDDGSEREAELQFLINVAEDLLVRIELGGELDSNEMATEARDLVVEFRRWLSGFPDDAAQAATKRRLYQLQEGMMESSPISSRPFRDA